MSKEIKALSEINYQDEPEVDFLATIIEIITPGDGGKKPFKALARLESTGEQFEIFSWNWVALEIIKAAEKSLNVFRLSGTASLYKDAPQIRLNHISDAGFISQRKKLNVVPVDQYRKEITEMVKTYISKNSIYYSLIDELILKNEKFWSWPAASKMHHAYEGGLAKHSLNVAKNSISIWKTYEGQHINIEAVVAGALLHDIGKLQEYNQDGSRTIYGDLIPHIISGFETITMKANELGANPFSDPSIIMLQHIILAHHDKLEFGSPAKPAILEAVIVSRADFLDANMEACQKSLDNTELNMETQPLAMFGNKFLKWHN